MVSGSCICKKIAFQIEGQHFDVTQCHCSKCRKATGSTADAMIEVPAEMFKWLQGKELISNYNSDKGSERTFCSNCGGVLPHLDGEFYWVPAGILDTTYSANLKAHIYVGSKLEWEVIGGNAPQYNENIVAQKL